MKDGSAVTERLLLPPKLWSTGGLRLGGTQAKLQALQQLHIAVAKARENAKVPDAQSLERVLIACRHFLLEARDIQINLARLFPFIPDPDPPEADDWNAERMSLGKLAGIMSLVASSVRKKASTVVERVGTALPLRLSTNDMKAYTDAVVNIASDAQVFDDCLALLESLRGDDEKSTDQDPDRGVSPQEVYDHLESVSVFFRSVLCEMLLRDVQVLAAQFLMLETANFVNVSSPESPEVSTPTSKSKQPTANSQQPTANS